MMRRNGATILNSQRPRRQGIILLEVLIALALLVAGLAVVGAQMQSGLQAAYESDMATRAVLLADTKMAELRAGVLEPERVDDILKGDFGITYPGYTWVMRFDETESDGLMSVELQIRYDQAMKDRRIASPREQIQVDEEEGSVIWEVYALYPQPADVNMERDYGIPTDELTMLAAGGFLSGGGESGDGSGDGSGEGGPGGEAGTLLGKLAEILAAYPDIIQPDGGIDVRALTALPADDFRELLSIYNMLTGGGGMNPSNMQQLMESDAAEQLQENAGLNDDAGN